MKQNGTLSYTNGDEYEGEYEYNIPNGIGTMKWADGDTYTGEWKDGYLNGKGTYTWCDGHYYSGEFLEGKKHGKGIMYDWDTFFSTPGWDDFDSASQIIYEGTWKKDEMHGVFKVIFVTGNLETTEIYNNGSRVDPGPPGRVGSSPEDTTVKIN